MLGAIENMREGDKGLFAIAIPVGIVIGFQVISADRYGGIGETLGDEVDLLDHAPLDDVVIGIEAQGTGFTIQRLFTHIVVDQQLQLLLR